MNKILAIVGPTASGKSALAMRAAEEFHGEIICVDSQTIRKGLDIGTAKPSKQDQEKIPHHMLDIIEPYASFSAAEFKRRAEKIITDIQDRGKLPILVGGTGLYMDAIVYLYEFNKKADAKRRTELNAKTVPELQEILSSMGIALPVNSNNPRHLIRAIESRGHKPENTRMREDVLMVGIDPQGLLPKRIETRVNQMLGNGLIDEVNRICATYGNPPDSWDAIGYAMIVDSVQNNVGAHDINSVARAITMQHRKYAKRQRSWFRRNKNIMWFEQPDDALSFIQKQL